MKKAFSLLLALLLTLGLTGCADQFAVSTVTGSDAVQDAVSAIGGVDGPTVTFEAVIDDEASDYTDSTAAPGGASTTNTEEEAPIDEDGWYYSAEDVSLYLVTYGELPSNYITKDEARGLGWTGGSVEDYAPGCAIGGDVFGNREGLLPDAAGRTYYECDIDTDGYGSRGSRRIVFSDDGLIYYTEDHYESFTLLYGEESP